MPTSAPVILQIGAGQLGLLLANRLSGQGCPVLTVSRRPIATHHGSHVMADARHLDVTQLNGQATQVTHLLIVVAPDQHDVQGYQDSYLAICQQMIKLSAHLPSLQRVIFISSTSVYGQQQGEWIDQYTLPQPATATAAVLLQCELLLQQHLGQRCCIIRPSGIYGRQRLRLVRMAARLLDGEPAPANHWTNRIFDEDLVRLCQYVIASPTPTPLYLATDQQPAPLYDVLHSIAQLQGQLLHLPTQQPDSGKRIISNCPAGLLHYPDHVTGYRAILATQGLISGHEIKRY